MRVKTNLGIDLKNGSKLGLSENHGKEGWEPVSPSSGEVSDFWAHGIDKHNQGHSPREGRLLCVTGCKFHHKTGQCVACGMQNFATTATGRCAQPKAL